MHRQPIVFVVLLVGDGFGGFYFLVEQRVQGFHCGGFGLAGCCQRLLRGQQLSHLNLQSLGMSLGDVKMPLLMVQEVRFLLPPKVPRLGRIGDSRGLELREVRGNNAAPASRAIFAGPGEIHIQECLKGTSRQRSRRWRLAAKIRCRQRTVVVLSVGLCAAIGLLSGNLGVRVRADHHASNRQRGSQQRSRATTHRTHHSTVLERDRSLWGTAVVAANRNIA